MPGARSIKYTIHWHKNALKEIKHLPREVQVRIVRGIEKLADTVYPKGAKKLQNSNLCSLRIGAYRVLYQVEKKKITIIIVRVGHRKDIYRS